MRRLLAVRPDDLLYFNIVVASSLFTLRALRFQRALDRSDARLTDAFTPTEAKAAEEAAARERAMRDAATPEKEETHDVEA